MSVSNTSQRQLNLCYPANFPACAWQKMGVDSMEIKCKMFVGIDYYSCCLEVIPLSTTTAHAVIEGVKAILARHGVVEKLISDNGPQFLSAEFMKFSKEWGFEHITSSPHYPQSNGESERAVQTAKGLLVKNKDPYLALLMY